MSTRMTWQVMKMMRFADKVREFGGQIYRVRSCNSVGGSGAIGEAGVPTSFVQQWFSGVLEVDGGIITERIIPSMVDLLRP